MKQAEQEKEQLMEQKEKVSRDLDEMVRITSQGSSGSSPSHFLVPFLVSAREGTRRCEGKQIIGKASLFTSLTTNSALFAF